MLERKTIRVRVVTRTNAEVLSTFTIKELTCTQPEITTVRYGDK
jgi:hypothetical protein